VSNYVASNDFAVPANTAYLFPLHTFKSFSAQKKQIRQEEKRKTIVIGDHDFIAVDAETVLNDVENTGFNRFLADAVQYMEEHAPNQLVQQALPYLRALNDKTTAYEILDFPPLSISLPDDGELLVEWNFEHFKIGLSFETNPEESGWYIVHDGTVRKMTGWAYLNSQTDAELVNTILSQVVENAP
jgi:hypothetical protein